jgi:hypothetical protein
MTIRDLIDLLENYPMDSKVVLAHRDYNYGYIRESSFVIEDVETYEEAVRKQAALAEQARLKEQAAKEQESKAKFIKEKQQPKDNPNKKSKP